MIDFSNTEIAFRSKSDRELKLARFLFSVMKKPALVKTGKILSEIAISVHFPIGWIVRPTLYRLFVGGETLERCHSTMTNLAAYNVYSILDYSAEGAESEQNMQYTFDETMRSIENAATSNRIAYAVFKPTALTTVEILERKSGGHELTEKEEKHYERFLDRMDRLARRAHELGVRLLIDAEHYATQPIIDKVTYDLMKRYNHERAIVFNTLQMYRHDRYDHLVEEHKKAIEEGYILGMKFVRGAYMDQERERAKNMGYADPICATKQDTDDNFDRGIAYCAENVKDIEFFCGTHNELSNSRLAALIDKLHIAPDDKRIFFAQLYGMSDNITYALANEGYNVCKYIPYGPVTEVLPYLIRRAEENTMVKGQTLRELDMINKEWKRRCQGTPSTNTVSQTDKTLS
ncbi:MAG: proline dehydrogenase family protein [Marinifilaceae bacterium]